MVTSRELLTISTLAVSISAIFAIVIFLQSAQTQASIEAIAVALENGDTAKALSIALNPQAILSLNETINEPEREIMEKSIFERLYGP